MSSWKRGTQPEGSAIAYGRLSISSWSGQGRSGSPP
jgi:hypothetical protein